ncbi:triacylglycerol lipase [Penicillium lagena]|uniref:triacylglycerol lipase n=1 Tax=Penicillium lagena TaxID=94218 RepID=UPI0025406724|nr:triacylglycerol lipase [Penicillium lagena]KAJ5619009.1 triacylglycerol lipase [Penicillium lagena]
MYSALAASLLTATLLLTSPACGAAHPRITPPSVKVRNGSYHGILNQHYDQDLFLGMPFAQPPVGDLRFRQPRSLNTTWDGSRSATAYYPECFGYSSDDWVLGNPVSEDCLAINVVRPHGVAEGDKLPVAVWIYGGGWVAGGSQDPRYNLSFIIEQSVQMDKPMIGVSLNYRLQGWGFMYGEEVVKEGDATNAGLHDQRLALHWIQENIAAFGGDPSKVVIWGQSAGAESVGAHLVAYGGRDDGLFRAGIAESGTPVSATAYVTASEWQTHYDAIVSATNCTGTPDTLACLRSVDTWALNDVLNSSIVSNEAYRPVIDGEIIQGSTLTQLREGKFAHVPLLIGSNFDEGTNFAGKFGTINTTAQFRDMVQTWGPNDTVIDTIDALYPDIPAIGIPATLDGRPPPNLQGEYGYQWKRDCAFVGDIQMHALRRTTTQMWAKYDVPAYSYHFNVLVNGQPPEMGATHFQEVAFVFHNIHGLGYETAVAVNPFANETETFFELATMMSRMWVSFVNHLDPNQSGTTRVHWPKYTTEAPRNMVFDVNVTNLAYIEEDYYRAAPIAYLQEQLSTAFGR